MKTCSTIATVESDTIRNLPFSASPKFAAASKTFNCDQPPENKVPGNDAEAYLFACFYKAAAPIAEKMKTNRPTLYCSIFGHEGRMPENNGIKMAELFLAWSDTPNGMSASGDEARAAAKSILRKIFSAKNKPLASCDYGSAAKAFGSTVSEMTKLRARLIGPYPDCAVAGSEVRKKCGDARVCMLKASRWFGFSYTRMKRLIAHAPRMGAIIACLPVDWRLSASVVRGLARIPNDDNLKRFVESIFGEWKGEKLGSWIDKKVTAGLSAGTIVGRKRGRKKPSYEIAIDKLNAAIQAFIVCDSDPFSQAVHELKIVLDTVTAKFSATIVEVSS